MRRARYIQGGSSGYICLTGINHSLDHRKEDPLDNGMKYNGERERERERESCVKRANLLTVDSLNY